MGKHRLIGVLEHTPDKKITDYNAWQFKVNILHVKWIEVVQLNNISLYIINMHST